MRANKSDESQVIPELLIILEFKTVDNNFQNHQVETVEVESILFNSTWGLVQLNRYCSRGSVIRTLIMLKLSSAMWCYHGEAAFARQQRSKGSLSLLGSGKSLIFVVRFKFKIRLARSGGSLELDLEIR